MKGSKSATESARRLLRQSDVVSYFHMQMPRWLFFDSGYVELSLEAKVAYTFLFNRFQLSRANGWQNKEGEVYILYPREKLAEDMRVSYKKAIFCFKELQAAGLIWERRLGRGSANQIYMVAVALDEKETARHTAAPFTSRCAESAALGDDEDTDAANDSDQDLQNSQVSDVDTAQDLPEKQFKICENGSSACAGSADPDLPKWHPSKKEDKKIDFREIESVSPFADNDPDEDTRQLEELLEICELEVLPKEEAGVFRNAITRLFYSRQFRVGNAVLPKAVIRSHLWSLNGLILLDAREKLRRNTGKEVKNSTAYIMAVIINNIWEYTGDVMVDPGINAMSSG